MVVRVSVVRLQQVVVDVLCRELGLHSIDSHGLQLQHHQRSGRVLGERLVDPKRDLRARTHLTIDEVRCDELA